MKLGSMQKPFKIIILVLLLIGGLAISIYAGSRVSQNFFGIAKASQCQAQKIKDAQTTANSAIISWETQDKSIGKVLYGTDIKNLAFSALEQSSEKVHNIPLTLLTPNTKYHYVVVIGKQICDSTGKTCDPEKKKPCIPYSFNTSQVTPQGDIVAPIATVTPLVSLTPILSSASATPKAASSGTIKPSTTPKPTGPTPTSGLSAVCQKVKDNIGSNSNQTAIWPTITIYNYRHTTETFQMINSGDVTECVKLGK